VVKLRFKRPVSYINLRSIRVFVTVIVFVGALDATIALNRWWTESSTVYLQNLTVMTVGFLIFSLLMSRSRLDFIGFIILSVAIFYTTNYEIGGPSKMYLTPFDHLLGINPVFDHGIAWMGMHSIQYRLNFAVATSALAALILTVSRIRRLKPLDST
jgi:hypothetical protein